MTGIVTSGQQNCCPIGSVYILDFADNTNSFFAICIILFALYLIRRRHLEAGPLFQGLGVPGAMDRDL
jgi:hypothetical protein